MYLSFDHIVSQAALTNEDNIELLLTQNQYEYNAIDFSELEHSFFLYKPVAYYKKKQKFDYQINTFNSLEHLKFNIQNHTVLNFKPSLLQIVINEISIQKSHCI